MRFSISVPVGSYHPFLQQCLESLAQQNVELDVALLDASGDSRVKALAEEYASVIAYVRHGPDGGQSAAILEGWENTPGDVLGWLNADDELFPGALEKAVTAFEREENFDVVYGKSTIVDEDDFFTGYHWGVEPPSDRILESGTVSQPSCFFKRSAYDAAGGLDADLHYTMDWDLFIRLHENGAKFGYIDEPLSKVLWGDDTKTSTFAGLRRTELQRIIRQYSPREKQRKILRSFHIHNVLDNIQPEFLKNLLTRSLVRGRKVVYGLAADGAIAGEANLYLVYNGKEKYTAVKVFCRNPEAIASVSIDGLAHKISDGKTFTLVSLEEPVPASQKICLKIISKPGQEALFERCEWAYSDE